MRKIKSAIFIFFRPLPKKSHSAVRNWKFNFTSVEFLWRKNFVPSSLCNVLLALKTIFWRKEKLFTCKWKMWDEEVNIFLSIQIHHLRGKKILLYGTPKWDSSFFAAQQISLEAFPLKRKLFFQLLIKKVYKLVSKSLLILVFSFTLNVHQITLFKYFYSFLHNFYWQCG